MKNLIKFITIHQSASDNPAHDDISVIDSWHRKRNFRKVGYNYFIKSCGSIQVGRAEGEILAHAKGHNKGHIAICLHGNKNIPTKAQETALEMLILNILDRHDIKRIYYHNELNKYKTCPGFKLDFIKRINEEIQAKEN